MWEAEGRCVKERNINNKCEGVKEVIVRERCTVSKSKRGLPRRVSHAVNIKNITIRVLGYL